MTRVTKNSQSIFLCASMNFYPKLLELEIQLKNMGFEVYIPVSAKMMRANRNFSPELFKMSHSNSEKSQFFRENLTNIEKCESILVINEEKNGIKGYIGTSVIMEIGIAFYLKKSIYLLNELSLDASYKPEIEAFGAKVINNNLENLYV